VRRAGHVRAPTSITLRAMNPPPVTTAPYGSWTSPLAAQQVAAAATTLGYATAHAGQLYWTESRPADKGRTALVTLLGGNATDVTPADFNLRTRVHEYGGRPFALIDEAIVFSHFVDQRLYLQRAGAAPARADAGRLPLCRWRGEPRRPHAVRGARGSQLRGRAGQQHRRPRPDAGAGFGRHRRCSTMPISSPIRAPAPTAGWRSLPGITRTCRGMRPRCMSAPSPPMACVTCASSLAAPVRRTSR
jgi:hypothetical protein